MGDLTRRKFLQGATAVAATSAFAALAGCESSGATASNDFLPETWDVEADLVVVGAGGGGIAAGIIGMQNGLETVVLEAAPEKYMGGNSRVCYQIVFTCGSVEDLEAYQTAMNGPHVVEPELVHEWAVDMFENYEWFQELGMDVAQMEGVNAEYPGYPGTETARYTMHADGLAFSRTWLGLKDVLDSLGGSVTCDSRVTELIFNPDTKEVFGVITEDGRNIKARKAVVLACGGFENNKEMLMEYYDPAYTNIPIGGTPYNRGDGIEMARRIGAKMWHMNNFACPLYGPVLCMGDVYSPEFADTMMTNSTVLTRLSRGSGCYDYIMVDPDGNRYMNEDLSAEPKHGKIYRNGTWVTAPAPSPSWMIAGPQIYQAGEESGQCFAGGIDGASFAVMIEGAPTNKTNQGYIDAGLLSVCETVEDIAEVTGIAADSIRTTLEKYNQYCADGMDLEYHRGEPSEATYVAGGVFNSGDEGHELMSVESPYYVMRFGGGFINTQGGAKRNGKCQIVDWDENPIPRLYGAGEFGSLYGYGYQAGCDFGDTIASGRRAAREVLTLTSWEAEE